MAKGKETPVDNLMSLITPTAIVLVILAVLIYAITYLNEAITFSIFEMGAGMVMAIVVIVLVAYYKYK